MECYKGTREAFAFALTELAARDERVVFVSADSLKAMRASAFANTYPRRYIEAGISEQSAVDIAAGLASGGLMPFVGTYGGFLTMRACEQMRTFTAYPGLNVKFIGINSGLIGGEREGVTHQFYEDIAILSAIPGFTILTPADAQQAYEAVKEAARIKGPVYVRLGSGRERDVYPQGTPFPAERVHILRSHGNDVTLFACGFLMHRVIAAADILREEGINVTLCDVTQVGGQPSAMLMEQIDHAKRIVTVEDHSVHGGLGAYIAELVCQRHPVKMKRIGLQTFGESGDAEALADQYGFSADHIAAVAKSLLEEPSAQYYHKSQFL